MKKCKICGSTCRIMGNGQYKCSSCGNFFSEDDFIDMKERVMMEAAKIKALEEARIQTEEMNQGANIFDKCKDGVLEIYCKGKTSSWSGSGYIISSKGYAITNAHVVAAEKEQPCDNIIVKVNKYTIRAQIIAISANREIDLAMIRLVEMPPELRAMTLGNYDKVRTGEKIYIIGNSLGYGICITSGIVSDKNRNGSLMYDCATNPGNSGSPVFNAKGEIIGTHYAGQATSKGEKAQGMNYAIPVSYVQLLVEKSGINL